MVDSEGRIDEQKTRDRAADLAEALGSEVSVITGVPAEGHKGNVTIGARRFWYD